MNDLTPEHTSRRIDGDLHPEVSAAYKYVDSVVSTADAQSPMGGYAWHGWALREAFLAGCTYARALLDQPELCDLHREMVAESAARSARALLDQSELKRPKPVVDYSRIPEIATEAEIRSAAQYLVKAKGCDGDLIPAIEYAIARWGANAQ